MFKLNVQVKCKMESKHPDHQSNTKEQRKEEAEIIPVLVSKHHSLDYKRFSMKLLFPF